MRGQEKLLYLIAYSKSDCFDKFVKIPTNDKTIKQFNNCEKLHRLYLESNKQEHYLKYLDLLKELEK